MTTGVNNTLIGGLAGDAITDADSNVAVGYGSLTTNVLGSKSVAVGQGSLSDQNPATAADMYNVAVGYNAGAAVTTGSNNTLIGSLVGDEMTSGTSNTAVGASAMGSGVVTGDDNTAIGNAAGLLLTSGGNNLFLGHDAGRSTSPGGEHTTGNHSIVLGNNSITVARIKVDWTVTSDERDKTDFTALDLGLDFVKAMKPYTFKWDQRSDYGDSTADDYNITDQTPDGTHKKDQLDVGFKAQDIEALEKTAGYKIDDKTNLITSLTDDGKQYGMKYSKFIPILVKAIQELEARVKELEG